MGAALDDPPLVHDEDAVCAGDGRQPVGNHEARPPVHQLQHRVLDAALGLRVHVGGGLVQDQHGGVDQHCTGDGQQLFLTLRDAVAAAGDDGVVALGQRLNHIVDVGGLCGADHVLAGHAVAAVGDVLEHRAVKEPGVLQNHGELPPQLVALQLADVHAVQQDRALRHVVKAHEQVDHRRLAAAGFAHDGHHLARLGGVADVVEDGLVCLVAEGNVAELDVAAAIADGLRVRVVRGLG